MDYNKQATDFLESSVVEFLAVRAVPQMSPRWAKDGRHGTNWSITLRKYTERHEGDWKSFVSYTGLKKEIQFFFWSSIKSKEDAIHSHTGEKKPKAYDVLAGLYMRTEDFDDFCSSFGYSTDSREAEATFKEVQELNKKLESIFTEQELEALNEIQ